MSTQSARSPPLRGYRRKKAGLSLDLNSPPVPEQESTSTQATSQPVTVVATIDVEAIDDDDDEVMVCSPSAFAEAKNKSKRNHGRVTVVDVDSEMKLRLKRRRGPSGQPAIDYAHVINLDSSGSSMVSVEKPAPPPKEPTFSCPICMGPLVEETSTKCGHIFCKACIRTAISTKTKCPTCRKRVTVRELIRVFLPATNLV